MNLTQGDCLFLPALWIHQVRSTGRNIAVNYWLNHQRVTDAIVDETTCELIDPSNFLTLETIHWPKDSSNFDQLQNFMLDLVDNDQNNFKDWTREFSKVTCIDFDNEDLQCSLQELSFDLQSNIRTITLFAEFFGTVDANGNGLISTNEIEYLIDSNVRFNQVIHSFI